MGGAVSSHFKGICETLDGFAIRTILTHIRGLPGPSGFGSKSTAEDVTANLDLRSKTVIVTGATSGLGKETARVLAKRGSHVIIPVRNTKAGEEVKAELLEEDPAARVDVMHLDLNSLASVRTFVAEFKSRNLPLNILINNAGAIVGKFELSEDGLEKSFATNHMGPFLLTNLLLDNMKEAAKQTGEEGRVVILSSTAHAMSYKGGIRFEKLNSKNGYEKFSAYGQSKLANILFCKELARRLKEDGANVTVNAVHPGVIFTNFGKDQSVIFNRTLFSIGSFFLKTVPQGAATSCYVATNPGMKGITGKYFLDCNQHDNLVSQEAKDMELAAKLWKFSEDFVSTP